jgi:hypothetical protein
MEWGHAIVAIGSWITPLFVAQQQEMFRKRNIEMNLVPAMGASVPRVRDAIPFGLVGCCIASGKTKRSSKAKGIRSPSRSVSS